MQRQKTGVNGEKQNEKIPRKRKISQIDTPNKLWNKVLSNLVGMIPQQQLIQVNRVYKEEFSISFVFLDRSLKTQFL